MAKTSIAIVGATGDLGSAIAKTLAKGPYRLLLIGSNAEKLDSLKKEINQINSLADLECVGCAVDACWEADVIITAVPYEAEKEVAAKVKAVATQKVVVSVSNPTSSIDHTTTSAAEELQKLLPASKVVKAFNTIGTADFLKTAGSEEPQNVFLAGNDQEAMELVKKLIRTAGFHPVVAGDLTASRKLEAER